uniref:sensor histidine kinase n=1 Tax=Nonomuraea pusilla TaxID=46177 RepID=UPI000A6426DF|nr:histidine kinase [Nonomuraea pusilla]
MTVRSGPADAGDHEYRWALPSVLLGDGGDGRPVRRSTRDWIVDTLMFVLACLVALLTVEEMRGQPEPLLAVEQVTGVLSCAAVWLRRRWPVALAVVTTVASTYLELVGGAALVGLFTVAVHRPFRVSGPVALLNLATLVPFVLLRPDNTLGGPMPAMALGAAILLAVFAWGIVVRARRQLVWSLRQRALTAAGEARRLERERIAREMHDVLAHRLSMLSLHAGALEFRPDAPVEEIARAAGAIRANAHLALRDLREVIGVLRHTGSAADAAGDEDETVPDRPQPTLADVPALVEECRQAGMDVRLDLDVPSAAPDGPGVEIAPAAPDGLDVEVAPAAPDGLDVEVAPAAPDGLGRNAYRIVQEALTNARKHAQGAPVTVTVSGAPGTGLSVEVRNPLAVRQGARVPGAGAGLIGLTERAELAGGSLGHGPTAEGDFLVRAWLPWPADRDEEER